MVHQEYLRHPEVQQDHSDLKDHLVLEYLEDLKDQKVPKDQKQSMVYH
jgi:hypothetical protein